MENYINLVTSPTIILLSSSKTVRDLDFTFADLNNWIVLVHIMLSSLHSEELDKCKSSGFSFRAMVSLYFIEKVGWFKSHGAIWVFGTCFFVSNHNHTFNCSALVVEKLLQLWKSVIVLSERNHIRPSLKHLFLVRGI
jgi:hypothetical protein